MFSPSVLVVLLVAAVATRQAHASRNASGNLLELSIIHLNDFHARFEQTSWNSAPCEGNTSVCVGGFPRVYTAVNRLVHQRPNAIFLNAGDNFHGTLWYTVHRWNVTAEFLNKLPTDAVTLGNHEFDSRLEGLLPFMDATKAPLVVTNIDDSLEPTFQGKYNKSVVIERAGRRIGIVGVIANNTKDLSSPGKLIFLPEPDSVAVAAAALKSRGVNIIIVLSHAGFEVDKVMAATLADIDVIVGGHSHTLLYTGTPPGGDFAADVYPTMVTQPSGRRVAIVQAGAYTKYLGNLSVWFDEQGELVEAEGNPILLDNSVEQDPDILRQLEPWKKAVDELGQKVVGSTKVLLDQNNGVCNIRECNIGNFLTDAMVEEYVNAAGPGSWTTAAIAFINSGGIRTSIEETHNGDITFNDLTTCQPFGNTIDTLELQGRHLRALLEQAISVSLGFLQMSGAHVTYDLSRPVGQRVVNLTVLCDACRVPRYQPLEDNRWYRIALPSFLVQGGDGYHVIPDNARNVLVGRLDVDVFMDYIEKNSPLINGVEGRIKIINGERRQ